MKKNSRRSVIVLLFIVFAISFVAFSAYSISKSSASNTADVDVAKFQIVLNGSTNLTQAIDLKSTITANDYSDDLVVPGTNGKIELEFDLSNVEVSVDYLISFDSTNLPNNLKFYTDSSYTTPVTSINETYLIGDSTTKDIDIYWKWDYLTDNASNENDNLFMGEDISLLLNIIVTQKVGGGN